MRLKEKYVVTKAQCQKKIHGVCEGCGGQLEPLRTTDNADNPTYWVGCKHCNAFRVGVSKDIWMVARKLVEEGICKPYPSLSKADFPPEKSDYWITEQTAATTRILVRAKYLFDNIVWAKGE